MYKVGSDIDGVLTTSFRPNEKDYVIISGRLVHNWQKTIKELGSQRPIYLRPFGKSNDPEASGRWKASIISYLKLEVFYEDEEIQARIIREINPMCSVRMVRDGELAEIDLHVESETIKAKPRFAICDCIVPQFEAAGPCKRCGKPMTFDYEVGIDLPTQHNFDPNERFF